MQQDTYTIKLTQFEGPFDLLLFFIERDELNIYDIPISSITEDFLAYIRQMEALNIDLASEFILVAATLMRIKAKMLIPRKEIDEEGNEIDPRDELVARLIEYKRYKGILEDMRGFEENRGKQFERGNISTEMKKLAERALIDAELESLTLFKLLKAFGGVLERMEDRKQKAVHKVYAYDYTIPNQQIYIFTKIREGKKTGFKEIFGNCENRMHAIITFLALLELLNMQKLIVTEGGDGLGVNVMVLEQPSHEDDVMTSHDGEDQEGVEDYSDDAEEGSARGGEMDEEPSDDENGSQENITADGVDEINNVNDFEANESEDDSGNEPGRAPDVDATGAGRSELANDNAQNNIESISDAAEIIESPIVDNIANDEAEVENTDSSENPDTNQTAVPLDNALEDMINSAIEVGATDVIIPPTTPNTTIENFSSEEE